MYSYTNPSIFQKGISMIKGIKWGTLLDGTQKTLGVINQAIPVFYQVKPIISNAKSLLKIANVMNEKQSSKSSQVKNTSNQSQNNSPVFYID